MVCVAWRGPSALDRYNLMAMGMLLEYLTDTPVAPLQRELVEVCVCDGVCVMVCVHACVCDGVCVDVCVCLHVLMYST